MDYQTELDIRDILTKNYNDVNISFPAVIVGVDNLTDGLVDVKPIVNYMNIFSRDTLEYPVIHDIPLIFPNTKNSSICFPVEQGDYVSLVFQSKPVRRFISGDGEVQDPLHPSVSDLSQAVAFVGFTPFQKSCLNPNNYSEEFNTEDLNIVHNKNTDREVSISLGTDGGVTIRSNSTVNVESPSVTISSESINADKAVVSVGKDILLAGSSLLSFMKTHSHIDSKGGNTTPPIK